MTSQINGLNVAVRNANDGISLAQTAEGAMQESTNILQRMRDLAVQSANGSNSSEDRQSLQKEVAALQTELTRIADTTTFGGQKILDGTYTTAEGTFQVGANKGETISFSIDNMRADALGQTSAQTIDAAGGGNYAEDNIGVADETLTFSTTTADGTSSVDVKLTKGMGSKEAAEAINAGAGSIGINASYDSGTGEITFTANNGITGATAVSDIATGTFANSAASIGTLGGDDSSTTGALVSSINISLASGAENAIEVIDSALAQVDDQRASLGAIQNRFESTISNLTNISENVSAARSRIRDVDFAQETAKMSQNQILQQAGTTILAQANQLPQAALSLLG
jgi:flagellin